jgi:DNA-binding NarL/FixJ family response regulator
VITVLLVDDHPLVRSGLVSLISGSDDITVVGEASGGAEAVALLADLEPDVVLMDLSMPGMDGVETTRAVRGLRPDTRVVVLTSFHDRERVTQALGAGAVGYVLKDSEPRDVLAAVRSAAQGHAPLDPRVAGVLLPSAEPSAPGTELSAREAEVLDLIAEGRSNRQIARALEISERTVKVHVGNIFRRIGVSDRTSAALWARDHRPRD